mgnify:CR=1 FL=1|jgi:hypothetical protein
MHPYVWIDDKYEQHQCRSPVILQAQKIAVVVTIVSFIGIFTWWWIRQRAHPLHTHIRTNLQILRNRYTTRSVVHVQDDDES